MSERPLFDPSRTRSAAGASGAAPPMLSPARVNEMVSGALQRSLPATLHVLGEIGDMSRAASGHLYLTLKDDQSELRSVMWRSAAVKLKFQPSVGMEVIATGAVEVYVPRGTYQLIVRRLEPRGIGALELAFRQLKEKLLAEGLFDAARKRPLPPFPARAAIVTSPSGAAIRDILQTCARRFPALELLVVPVRVQGDGAADEIARAIRLVNAAAAGIGGIDVMIIGRGGGSLEDLWAFNEEVVARAIAASAIPIISAVGHETDVSISDLVADVRAATPTAAAELITPSAVDLLLQIRGLRDRATRLALQILERGVAHLQRIAAAAPLSRPTARIDVAMQRLDECGRRLALALLSQSRRQRDRLSRVERVIARFGAGAEFARRASHLSQLAYRIRLAAERRLSAAHHMVMNRHALCEAALRAHRFARFDEHVLNLSGRMQRAMAALLERRFAALTTASATLDACDPKRVLARGFSLSRDARTGRVLRSIREVSAAQRVRVELADGEFRATADDPRQPRLFE